MCAKWQRKSLDWFYWPVVQSSNTVSCVSLSFRTHVCVPDGTKPLPEPMLIGHQLGSTALLKPFSQELLKIWSRKMSLKITLVKSSPHLLGINELISACMIIAWIVITCIFYGFDIKMLGSTQKCPTQHASVAMLPLPLSPPPTFPHKGHSPLSRCHWSNPAECGKQILWNHDIKSCMSYHVGYVNHQPSDSYSIFVIWAIRQFLLQCWLRQLVQPLLAKLTYKMLIMHWQQYSFRTTQRHMAQSSENKKKWPEHTNLF